MSEPPPAGNGTIMVTCFVGKLNDAVVKALADPEVRKRIATLGMTIPDKAELTPKALHDFHQAEIDKWWPIIKSYGIKVN